jgi:tetratricopeptide (TPR) repeat protein
MKLGTALKSRRALAVALLLALTGAGLVGLSAGSSTPVARAFPPSPVPTAPWGAMPTRAQDMIDTPEASEPVEMTATPTPDPRPERLQQALLAGDLAAAQRAWDVLQGAGLGETHAMQMAGARLALMSHDLEAAEQRALRAVDLAAAGRDGAYAWSLLGITMYRKGEYAAAEQAFSTAQDLDPGIAPSLFDDRWRAAVRAEDTTTMALLAGSYSMRDPQGHLEPYYRASALLADHEPRLALGVLLPALSARPDAHALLWYTLGDVYVALGGFREAATVLEVAAAKVAEGDSSLSIVSDAPIDDLALRLARAYLATDRCREAEGIYRRLSASHPELADPLDLAITCQTPTPTMTPWILRLQSTPTP